MLKTRLLAGFATTALLVPQLTFAASPQQTLDQAARLLVEHPTAQNVSLDITMDGSFVPSRRLSRRDAEASGARTTPTSFQTHIIVEGSLFPHANANGVDGQGRIRLVKVASTGEPVVDLSNLGSVEWRVIGDVFYIRIASISSELRTYMQGTGLDIHMLDGAVGTWLKIDPQGLTSFIQQALPVSGAATITTHSSNDLEKLLRTLPLFQLVKMEKNVTQGDQTYTRLSVRLHPGFWTRLEKMLAASIETDLQDLKAFSPREYPKQRALRLAAMRKSLKETRTSFTNMRLILMVNTRSGRIERMEGAWQETMPSYAYLYRGNRSVKILEGQEKVQIRFAGSLQTIETRTVQEPTPFVTIEALITQLMGGLLGGSLDTETATSTLVAPITP